ncbi:hypothetical protein P5V15_012115 [Pogonomyrmex californicus]
MTEPEIETDQTVTDQTEPEIETDQTVTDQTSELLKEVKTDAIDTDLTEDATTDDQISIKYKSTDYQSEINEDKEKGSWVDRRWAREDESFWPTYMKSYVESRLKLKKEDERKTTTPDVAEVVEGIFPPYECFPLGGFQLEHRPRTTVRPDRRRRMQIWRNMRARQSKQKLMAMSARCGYRTRDTGEGGRRKRRDEDEPLLREQRSDFANRKELGHVRVPVSYPEMELSYMMNRAAGERPGLVDGDYVIVQLQSKRKSRVYANVVLHGLKGMHLPELSQLRERRNTWKFCFYQAIVALLAKTQLRYKYAWSANIDYIYDHAWMLYTHIGTINVKAKQRLDDVVVYNYKYNVELELIQEMKDVPAANVTFFYRERGLKEQITLRRKDPLRVRVELGCQKVTDPKYMSVHAGVRKIEKWLGKLAAQYRDCIFRTTRFSLAFWQDGLFWYLYNPYRCDEFGFWDDDGRACIVKFCSADSLRRHLMILLLRAYAHKESSTRDEEPSNVDEEGTFFDVQIFHMTFHSCQLHNLKLCDAFKRSLRADEAPSDSLEIEDTEDGRSEDEDEDEDCEDPRESRERVTWLRRRGATTWGKRDLTKRQKPGSAVRKARWHQYYVEEPNRLFSLWGEIHITDGMFEEVNRGMQAYACYVVCAGMTRITAPECWSPKTLDAIVICGDRYYTYSKRKAESEFANEEFVRGPSRLAKYLSDRFEIGGILFEVRILPAVCGKLYAKSSECLWRTLERTFSSYHFVILTCESACLGLFKFCGAYYVCDVNSYGPPLFQHGYGAAYLLRATSFRKFVPVLVLIIDSPEQSRFSLNPIEILRIVEMDATLKSRAKARERRYCFGKLAGIMPGAFPKFAFDGQNRRRW